MTGLALGIAAGLLAGTLFLATTWALAWGSIGFAWLVRKGRVR